MPTRIDFDDYTLRGADPDFLAKRRQILAGQLDSIMARPEVPTWRVGQTDIEPPRNLPMLDTGGIKAQIGPTFHGSPFKFSQFVDEKIGAGTGGQAFGRGHYTSEVPGVAGYYNKLGKGRDDTLQLYKGSEQIIPESEAERLAYDNAIFYGSVNNILDVIKRTEASSGVRSHYYATKGLVLDPKYRDIDAVISTLKQWQKEGIELKRVQPEATFYQTTLHKGKDPSQYDYISWYENLTPSQQVKAAKALPKMSSKDESSYTDMVYRAKTGTGKDVLNILEYQYGQEGARQKLMEAGFSGIKYPVGTLGGKPGKGTNYVTFDPSEITIDRIGSQRVVRIEEPKELRSVAWNLMQTSTPQYLNTVLKDLKKAVSEGKLDVEAINHNMQNGLYEAAQQEIKRGTLQPMEAMKRVKEIGDKINSAFPRPKIDYQQLKKQMGGQTPTKSNIPALITYDGKIYSSPSATNHGEVYEEMLQKKLPNADLGQGAGWIGRDGFFRFGSQKMEEITPEAEIAAKHFNLQVRKSGKLPDPDLNFPLIGD